MWDIVALSNDLHVLAAGRRIECRSGALHGDKKGRFDFSLLKTKKEVASA
jgi:hypothetical protein